MDWIKVVVRIKSILNENGFDDLSNKITNAQLVLGTPGEIFLNVIQALTDIKETNKVAFALIEKEFDSMIQFAKDMGFYS